jgi:hypothetical protein
VRGELGSGGCDRLDDTTGSIDPEPLTALQ